MSRKFTFRERVTNAFYDFLANFGFRAHLQRDSEAELWALIAEFGGMHDESVNRMFRGWVDSHPHNAGLFTLNRTARMNRKLLIETLPPVLPQRT